MSIDKVPLLTEAQGPSACKFGASKEFQTLTQQQELDSAFLGSERRPWIQAKPRPKKTSRERETIRALLGKSFTSNSNNDNVKELIEENISFRDLASLTGEDLELFGFASAKERNELMKLFSQMPNQDPSYDYLCNTNAAKGFNNQIIGNAANHIQYLRSSLAATNYKLQVMPPEDVIVGDKRYASRFALEALNSVQSISDEIINDLRKLEKLARKQEDLDTKSKERNLKFIYYTTLALGTACAWFWWWSKRNQAPNLQNVSIKI